MAKLVNKKEKRKEIALSCKDLLLEKGIKNITVSEIAKVANIGKGTVYEYFENKEDIVFEIVNIFIKEYNKNLFFRIKQAENTYEKLVIFFEFFYENNTFTAHYKEFLAISIISPTKKIIEFKTDTKKMYYEILEKILSKGIESGEIKSSSLKLIKIIYNMAVGLFIESETTSLVKNKKEEFKNELKIIYDLIRIEK